MYDNKVIKNKMEEDKMYDDNLMISETVEMVADDSVKENEFSDTPATPDTSATSDTSDTPDTPAVTDTDFECVQTNENVEGSATKGVNENVEGSATKGENEIEIVNENDIDLPLTPTFGGGAAILPPASGNIEIKEVPVKEVGYNEQSVRKLAIGSPEYLSVLPTRIKERPGKISTGISELDYITGGGWSSGLNVVTAAPGTGKTTILIQSAVKMAQQGTAVVYITNDMRELDLTAKAVSGCSYSLIGENCLTIGDILYRGALAKETSHTRQVLETVGKTMPYLHIRDLIYDETFDKACNQDVILAEMDKIERIFHVYCNTYERVVFIADSLQQIAGYTAGGKEGVDSMLRQFKHLSRKYSVPIIMISTLNRNGYAKQGPITFADLKESGSIEYDSDIILTMVPRFAIIPDLEITSISEFKQRAKRDIIISCIKSRDSEEREVSMTLYAPGCTFIPYAEKEETHVDPIRKKKSKSAGVPALGTMNWRGFDM